MRAQCSSNNVTLDLPITVTSTDMSDFTHPVNVVNAAYVNGQDGIADGALHFNAQNQYATIPPHAAFESMTEEFTMSAWIYPTSFLSENAIISKLNGSNRNFVFRYQDGGKLHFHYTRSGGLTFVTTDSIVIEINTWQHVAATWDGDKIRLYVDGELKKEQVITDEGPTFQAAGSVRLGTLNFSSERMVGYLDNVQMRAYATTEEEIKCLESSFVSAENNVVLNMPLNNSSDDISDNNNDGNFYGIGVGTDRWGQVAKAVNFNGSGYVSVPNIVQYNGLTTAYTISAWIKPSVVTGSSVIISKAGTGREIVIRIDNGKLTAHYYVTGYVWCTPAVATVNANEWSHVACTWDGTTMSLYHNGELLQTIEPAMLPSFGANDWSIGSLTTSGGEYFNGQMDDVKVWDRAMTICEVRSDFTPFTNLLSDSPMILCQGQTSTLTAPSGYCTYNWVNDGSSAESFIVDADDFSIGDHQIVLEAYDIHDNLFTDTIELTVSLCTGTSNLEKHNQMRLFPNPSSTTVTVHATGLVEIKLLDMAGRFLESTPVTSLMETALDVSHIPAGVYFITGTRKDGTVLSERLIKH